ncbi:hypothetical protein CYMTET_46443 [Cymbomonas tetramitiformis]|uniref:Uncharacterized protein n=1 Tax=Cymbomonas tetramitiformis TaxID=36881 RepID=A0AAE0BW50_9CHLO|nr:hypothetical protein CYMTET_46443 [Cymbomonas tetramitiformis]
MADAEAIEAQPPSTLRYLGKVFKEEGLIGGDVHLGRDESRWESHVSLLRGWPQYRNTCNANYFESCCESGAKALANKEFLVAKDWFEKAAETIPKMDKEFEGPGMARDKERKLSTSLALGEAYHGLGNDFMNAGQTGEAKHAYNRELEESENSLQLSRTIANKEREMVSLLAVGRAKLALGMRLESVSCCENAKEIALSLNDKEAEGKCYHALAGAYYIARDQALALQYYKYSLKVTEELEKERLAREAEMLEAIPDEEPPLDPKKK